MSDPYETRPYETRPYETREDLPRSWAGVFVGVGLVCGLGAFVLTEEIDAWVWQSAPTFALLITGLAFCLSVNPQRWLPAALGSLALGLLLGILGTTFLDRFGPGAERWPEMPTARVLTLHLIVAQIALPFFQTWQERGQERGLEQGRFNFPYQRLFAHAWNNTLIVALSLAFAVLLWILLWLFAALFDLVGIDWFSDLIGEPAFFWPATTIAIAFGVYAGRDYHRVVVALRRIVFSLFSVLTPLFLLLSLGFLLALVFGGFEKMTTVVSAATTLVTLLVLGVVLLNAVLRDGSAASDPGRVLNVCAVALAPALTLLCGFALYAVALRIGQYGLTPDRIWIGVTAGVLMLHALAYLLSLIARERWMAVSRQANIGIAVLVALTAIALQTPWGDPYRVSAESQYQRLASGAVDPALFDYGFLKFNLGDHGEAILERIAEDAGVADEAVVAEQLAALATAETRWQWRQPGRQQVRRQSVRETLSDPERVTLIPADLEIPEDLHTDWLHGVVGQCGRQDGQECMLTAIDLTESEGLEYVLALRGEHMAPIMHLFERRLEGDGWASTFIPVSAEAITFWSDFAVGRIDAVTPAHRDLKVGDQVIPLRRQP